MVQDDVKGFSSSIETGNVKWYAPERFFQETEKASKMSDIYEFASTFYEVHYCFLEYILFFDIHQSGLDLCNAMERSTACRSHTRTE